VRTALNRQALLLPPDFEAYLIEYSPHGHMDDLIYAKCHDVWEKLPRGCAILEVLGPRGFRKRVWAIRGSRFILVVLIDMSRLSL